MAGPDSRLRRYYRIAEHPYGGASAVDAGRAEWALRRKLGRGEIPDDVCLVAPERGTEAAIGPAGTLDGPASAWDVEGLTPLRAATIERFTLGGLHVVADIDPEVTELDTSASAPAPEATWATRAISDPTDEGTVVVTAGRVASLDLAPWLRPVAQQLADRYGVAVYTAPGSQTPVDMPGRAPVFVQRVLTLDEAAYLREYLDDNTWFADGKLDITRPPGEWPDRMTALAARVGEHFGLATTQVDAWLTHYRVGGRHDWHIDRNWTDPLSLARTVSLSVILSDAGRDYDGGVFETNDGPVHADIGDAIMFTAGTRHRVTPVTRGDRYVVIVFGSWDGWTG